MANLNLIFFLFMSLFLSIVLKCDSLKNRCPTFRVENGRVRILGRIATITCNPDYRLVHGRNTLNCIRHQWDQREPPVCAKLHETYLACDFESSDDRFCGWKNDILNDVDWLADKSRSLLYSIGRHVSPGSSQYFTGSYISLDTGTFWSGVTGRLLSPEIPPVNDQQINRCLIFSYVVRSVKSYEGITSPILSVSIGGVPLWETSVGEGRAIIGLYKLNISSTIIIQGKYCEVAIDNLLVTEGTRCTEQPYKGADNTCQDNCGIKISVSSCSCDWECLDNENCCSDIEETCPYIKPLEDIARLYLTTTSKTTTTTTTVTPNTTTYTPTTSTTSTTVTLHTTTNIIPTTSTTTTTASPPTTTITPTTITLTPTTNTTTTTTPTTITITPTTTTNTTTTTPTTITITPTTTTNTTTTTTSTASPKKNTIVKYNSTNSYKPSFFKVIHDFIDLNSSTRGTTEKNVNKDTIYAMTLSPKRITSLNITYTKFPSPSSVMTTTIKPNIVAANISSAILATKIPFNSTTMSSISASSKAIYNATSKLINITKVPTKSAMENNRAMIKTLFNTTTTFNPLVVGTETISTIELIGLLKVTTKSVTQNTPSMTPKLPLVTNISSITKLMNSPTTKINITDKSSTPTIIKQPSNSLNTIISSNIHGINNIYGINKNNNISTNLGLNVTYTSTYTPKKIAVNHNISLASPTLINLKHTNILKPSAMPINNNNLTITTTENTNLNFKLNKTVELPHEKTELNYDLYNNQKKNTDNPLKNPGNQNDNAEYSNKLYLLVTISTYLIATAIIFITLFFIYSYFTKSSHIGIHSCFIKNENNDSSCQLELLYNSVE